jgi:purine-binding chemotaxis protein CheW
MASELLVVEVAGHRFGLPADAVLELVPVVASTALPGAPPAVEGLVNRRGEVVAVVDLAMCLGLPSRPARLTDHLVVVRAGARVLALRVDHAADLVAVPPEWIDDAEIVPGADGTGARASGVVKLEDGLLVVADPTTLLSSAELVELEHLEAGMSAALAPAFGGVE